MSDFVAYTSRRRTALLILGSIAFVVLGLWMAGLMGPVPVSRRFGPEMTVFWGWTCIVFFGLCAAFGAKIWWQNAEQLRIGEAGITYLRWSEQIIPWDEINDVTEWNYKGTRTIVLHLRNPSLYPGKGLMGLVGQANRRLTGGDIGMSMTSTDCSFDEAMAVIAEFRELVRVR